MSVARHRREAASAKASMLSNVDALKSRLSPTTLVSNAVENVREKAITVADQTAETARRRPALAGTLAGTALLLLARRPLFGIFNRVTGKRGRSEPSSERSELEQIEGHPS